MKFEIEEKQAQVILNYLAQKPYAEVFQLVVILQNLKKIEDKEVDKIKKSDII